MSLFSNFVKQVQKETDKQLKGFEGSVKTELKGAKDTILTEIRGAGSTLGLNLDQDFMPKIEFNMPSLSNQKLNLDQDFTRINLPGIANELTNIGSTLQEGAVDIASAVQAQAVRAGSAMQQNLIDAGRMTQDNAIALGTKLSEGQSNPTLEGLASGATKATEANIAGLAGMVQANEQGFTKSAETNIEGATKTTEQIGKNVTKSIEALPEVVLGIPQGFGEIFDFYAGGSSGGQATGGDNLAPAPTIGDSDELPMEQATSKAGQMTEEERLRRMRRLLLNRYGREDTILSGGNDTQSRRRYAL
tara:strand:+ start:2010 stop:2921 length:912 start_codon:yes stop_codon:yes gene_type:complete